MEMIEGRIFWHVTLPDIGHDERAAWTCNGFAPVT
jgi:hypothetical protein